MSFFGTSPSLPAVWDVRVEGSESGEQTVPHGGVLDRLKAEGACTADVEQLPTWMPAEEAMKTVSNTAVCLNFQYFGCEDAVCCGVG